MEIRPERPADAAEVAALVEAAFGEPGEARLVEALRASPAYLPDLTLVALDDDGGIVGHVMVSLAVLDDGILQRPIASLAPLAVAPASQRRGVGRALLAAVAAAADDRGEPLIVLQGSPDYYGRFGYEHATPLGIEIDLPDWAPPEAAQVLRLHAYDPAYRGRVVYPPAFDDL